MSIQATIKPAVQVAGGSGSPKSLLAPVGSIASTAPVSALRDDAVAALRHLLRVEGDIRDCRSIDELGVLLVNETRKMTGARAAYFLELQTGKPRLVKASGAGEFDRNAPVIQWLESELKAHPPLHGWEKTSTLALRNGAADGSTGAATFHFRTVTGCP